MNILFLIVSVALIETNNRKTTWKEEMRNKTMNSEQTKQQKKHNWNDSHRSLQNKEINLWVRVFFLMHHNCFNNSNSINQSISYQMTRVNRIANMSKFRWKLTHFSAKSNHNTTLIWTHYSYYYTAAQSLQRSTTRLTMHCSTPATSSWYICLQ